MSEIKSDRINYHQQSLNILSDNPELSIATDGIWDIFADELVDLWKVLGSRWVLLLLETLNAKHAVRFNELKRLVPGISSTVLADRLSGLELEGPFQGRFIQKYHPRWNIG